MRSFNLAEAAYFLVYLMAQVLLFKNLVLFNVGFCFPYIAFILFMAADIGGFLLIALGFTLGIAIDIFYDSPGLHACALVFLSFIRNFWLRKIIPQAGNEAVKKSLLSTYGLPWLSLYIVPLILVHHTIIFFVEIGGFKLIGFTLLKILCSTIFTASVIILIQYLRTRSHDKRKI